MNVVSRLADERLWAEALNPGAYDMLLTPFEAEEVFRVIGWRRLDPLGGSASSSPLRA